MPLSAAVLETLHEIVGDHGFVTNKAEIAPFLEESRGRFEGSCDLLLKPQSTSEIAQIMGTCYDHDIPVTPQGGNTGHCAGALPNGGVLLNLSRLNTIREIDPLNGSICVEAGCILQDVQNAASEAGFLFPLSLASEGSCQIGGNLATNAGGVHVLRYGNMRDLTLGLEVVLPDGRLWDGLRHLKKDNSGYALKHLFMGAEGTLGVITAAVLKLHPKPKETVTCLISARSVEDLLQIFAHLRDDFASELNAFEMIGRFALDLVLKHFEGTRHPLGQPAPWYALVEVATSRPKTRLSDSVEKSLQNLLEKGLASDVTIAQNTKQAHDFWQLRENISEAQKREGGSIKHDISLPLSAMVDFLIDAEQVLSNQMADLRLCTFGHVGDGNLHYNVSQPEGMDKAAFLGHWDEFNQIIHDLVFKYNGSFSAEHGIGQLKTTDMERYRAGVELDVMREIKTALDPQSLMNPGKVTG